MTTPLFETPGAAPNILDPAAAPGHHVPNRVAAVGTNAGAVAGTHTAPALIIEVYGTPAPQGSKRHVGNGVMVESSKKVKPWREAVKFAALGVRESDGHAHLTTFDGPVAVNILFRFARPKFHFRTGANSHLLRAQAPAYPAGRPDLDKCARSTLDALGEAGVFRDDAQVVVLGCMKGYADHQPPGAHITVSELT